MSCTWGGTRRSRRIDELVFLDALLMLISLLLVISFFLQPPAPQNWQAHEVLPVTGHEEGITTYAYPVLGYEGGFLLEIL